MISRDRALAELRRLARHHGALGVADLRAHGAHGLYDALLHHFDSLDAARMLAGVSAPTPWNRRWTVQAVIAELQRAHRAGIRITNVGLINAGLRGLSKAAIELCGGLPRARRMARITEPARLLYDRQGWDEDLVIAEIRALHRAGKSLAFTKAPRKLVNAAKYHLGGWRDAVEVAGLDYDRVRLVRAPYSRRELIDLVSSIAKRAPRTTLAQLHDHRAAEAWIREFGSVEAAVRAAGIRGWPVRRLAPLLGPRAVLAAVRARHRAGSTLMHTGVAREDSHLMRSAERCFGSWRSAVLAARLPASAMELAFPTRRWTKAVVVKALHARRRAGASMSPSVLRVDDHGLFQAAKKYVGYNARIAIRDWGAPRLVTKWTKRTLLDALRTSHATGEEPRGAISHAAIDLFGSMEAARRAARVPVLRTAWTDERVIEEIRALRGARASGGLVSIAQYHFGSWRAALEAAGVKPKTRTWDAASIAVALQARVDRGLPLEATTVRREESSLFHAVEHRFGPFARAVSQFERTGRLPRERVRRRPGRPAVAA